MAPLAGVSYRHKPEMVILKIIQNKISQLWQKSDDSHASRLLKSWIYIEISNALTGGLCAYFCVALDMYILVLKSPCL